MKKIKESNGFPTSGSPRRPESDFYPTPVWATEALLKCEQFVGDIWEPACGLGAMSKVLEQAGYCVKSTDLYEYGYGEAGWDFISALSCYKQVPNIVTNPPYNQAEDFITQGIKLAEKKVAMLLRLAFLEGIGRYGRLYSVTPPSRVWVFSSRLTMYPNGVEPTGRGTQAMAWFVWDKRLASENIQTKTCTLGWIPKTDT